MDPPHEPHIGGHQPAARTKRPGSSMRPPGQQSMSPPFPQFPGQQDPPRRRPGPVNQAPVGLLRAVADSARLNRLSDDGIAPAAVVPGALGGALKPGPAQPIKRDVVGQKEAAALTALLMKSKPRSGSPPNASQQAGAVRPGSNYSRPSTSSFHGPPKHSLSSSALSSKPSQSHTPGQPIRTAHVQADATVSNPGAPSPLTAPHVPYNAQISPAGLLGAGSMPGASGQALSAGGAPASSTPATGHHSGAKSAPTPAAAAVPDPADEPPFPQALQQLIGQVLDALIMEGDLPDRIPQNARTRAKKLKTGAHNAVQPMYIGFEEARLRLAVAHFTSIQEFYREIDSHCQACFHSLEEANEGNPAFDPYLRQYLQDVAQQYASEVINACEELAESKMGKAARRTDPTLGAAAHVHYGSQSKAKAKASKALPVDDGMPPLPGAGLNLPLSVTTNTEPYFQAAWRREPFPPRSYKTLTSYELHGPTPDEKQLLQVRLTTRRPNGASEHFRLEHQQLGSRLAAVESQLAKAVDARDTLKLGQDVIEIDSWGIDMYTRKNVFDALYESKVFTDPQLVGSLGVKPATPSPPPPPDTGHIELMDTDPPIKTSTPPPPDAPPADADAPAEAGAAADAQQPADAAEEKPSVQGVQGVARAVSAMQLDVPARPPTPAAALHPSQQPLSPQVRARMAALERGGWASPAKHAQDGGSRGNGGGVAGQRLDFAAAAGGQAGGVGQDEEAETDKEADAIHAWIDYKLLPAINYSGLQGYNMLSVCDTLRAHAAAQSDPLSAVCADVIDNRVRQCGWPYFRMHPKGRGITCTKPGGIPAYTFVEEYLGELYSPWRWWEVQDAIKKLTGEEELPDFYNITLERPRDDPEGYDMLYVEAAFKATFASRMSHSCTPNCQAVVVSAGGRLTIAMYTLRHVEEGEELTFDYNCVTESEKEFRSAICLCGTESCRGSYLHFLGAKAFQLALDEHHTLLHRQSIILRACVETFTEADAARLREHGLGSLALGQALPGAPPCPTWLHKWTALTLEYVELERTLLPDLLLKLPPPYDRYTEEYAQAQAQSVMSSRVSSIFVTLDKIKLFLRHPGQLQHAPLRILTEQEVLSHLWTSDKSMMHRLVLAAATHLGGPAMVGSLGHPWTAGAPDQGITREELCSAHEVLTAQGNRSHLLSMLTLATREVKSLYEARKGLLEVEAVLRMCEDPYGVHTAAADVIHLAACTVVWFTAERNYKGFTSPPVILNEETLKLHKSMAARTSGSNSGASTLPVVLLGAAGGDDDSMDVDETSESEVARRRLETAAGTLSKRYGPWFIWGQLNAWYKQTVADPCASLSAERRGTLSLPDVESCYNTRGPRYNAKERAALLEHIEKRPDTQWKSTSSFTFKNEAKVYGSPMFDSVYLPKVLGTPASLPEVVKHLRSVALPWPAASGTGRGPGRPRKDAGPG